MSETIAAIVAAHRAGRTTPEQTVRRAFARIRAHGDAGVFLALRPEMEAVAEACLVAAKAADLPLLGLPVAVQDNIDVEGLPTTAGCAAFAYEPRADAGVVTRLKRAGAVVVGKTNLDQFAAGYAGIRTSRPAPRNALDARFVPGGSSSGCAVAVAAGLVPLAIGTETAGGGLVPAALNNIVGLKPSLGLVSTAGLVPACRTLDCVSLFALTVDDAWTALRVLAGPDPADAFARPRPLGTPGAMARGVKVGAPRSAQRIFFGDAAAAAAYETALARLAALGAALVEIDFEPFVRAARLMREGPWIAERYVAARPVLESAPQNLHPVTREVLLGGARKNAAEAFTGFHQLAALRHACERVFREIDALALPTVPTVYTVEQVRADPVELDAQLGVYGSFVNLLDLCALAVPASLRKDGAPFGIMLAAPAGKDALLASIGRVFHASAGLGLGARNIAHPPLAALAEPVRPHEIVFAVVGGHLGEVPLEGEMRARGARFLETSVTGPDYRLFAIDGEPTEPALARAGNGKGRPIAVDLWALPADRFGHLVTAVAEPFAVGAITLADGRTAQAILSDAALVKSAPEVSRFGSWKSYLAARAEASALGGLEPETTERKPREPRPTAGKKRSGGRGEPPPKSAKASDPKSHRVAASPKAAPAAADAKKPRRGRKNPLARSLPGDENRDS